MRNFTRTKNLFLAVMLMIFSSVNVLAQVTLPHHDAIDYASGGLQTQTGWTALNTGDDLLISTGSLTYSGLEASTGNKVTFDGLGIDAVKEFTEVATGTVYASFLMNVSALGTLDATNGGYFSGLAESTTLFGAAIWTRLSGAGYNIGVSPRTVTSTIAWSTEAYSLNTTVLVVVAYQLVDGTANDIVKMWINPTPGSAEPTATLTATNTGGTDLTKLTRLLIRQDSATETPSIAMDEIRIGTSWADVTPNGVPATLVTSITVTGEASATTITTAGGTLQMSAAVLPVDATDSTVTWSVVDGTGHATISSTGLLTASLDGTVTVVATANDESGIVGQLEITLSNQNPEVLVSSIEVSGAAGATTIETYHGTLQMSAVVLPANATDTTFVWSVVNGTGTATISTAGLLTAATNGTVMVFATANDASGIIDSLEITLSNQVIPQTAIYDIQYSTATTGDSPMAGQVVTVTGIVTAKHYNYEGGTYKGFFIQDAPGAYNGIYVYGTANTPTVGDEVTITATVKEYNGLTELDPVTSYAVNSSGNAMPSVTVLTTGDAAKEAYEGVLIRTQFAQCTTAPTTYNDFNVNDGTGVLNVDDDLFKFVPTVSTVYDITGIGHYGYSVFKILPRNAADIVEATISTKNEILSFVLGEESATAVIDSANGTVAVQVFTGTNVTALIPTITVSPIASISPASGVAQDFTNPVTYTVTAQDGSTKQFVVTVTVSSTQNIEAEIESVSVTDQIGSTVVNSTAGTVTLTVFPDVSLTALNPTIAISAGASISPTGAQNFTSPVTYTVTSQSGVVKTWTVTIAKQTITTINAIQNSTGDSPLKNQVVTTTGTVAGIKNYDSTSGLMTGYFIQSGRGAFTGIYVESPNAFAIGDSIFVTGTVVEKYSHTVINAVTASKLTQPGLEVYTNYISVGQANSESYESCLIKVKDAVCSVALDSYGVWKVTQGTDEVQVDDVLLPMGAFDALGITVGNKYSITGFMYYSYSKFNILPRDVTTDIFIGIDEVTIKNVDIYPNPVNSELSINNIKEFSSIKVSNLLGQTVANINIENADVKVNFESLEQGIYLVTLYC